MRRRVAATMSSRPTGIRKASIIREGGDPRISGQTLVPKKGLEPPHPCGYMDLNHARLPIPPLRQVDYFARLPCGIPVRKNNSLFYRHFGTCQTNSRGLSKLSRNREASENNCRIYG